MLMLPREHGKVRLTGPVHFNRIHLADPQSSLTPTEFFDKIKDQFERRESATTCIDAVLVGDHLVGPHLDGWIPPLHIVYNSPMRSNFFPIQQPRLGQEIAADT